MCEADEAGMNCCRPSVLAIALAALAASPVPAATPTLQGNLYAGAAPGSETWTEPRVLVECNGEASVYNTREPRFDLFLPEPDTASGAAVLMLPGGGLRLLGMGVESEAEVEALLAHGIAVMRLEYRTRQIPAGEIPRRCVPRPADAPPIRFPKMEIRNGNANPAPNDPVAQAILGLAVADAQAALKMLHENAPRWHLDPDRIGALGTSAGGGVALGALLSDAAPETKPDFLISIFGPALQDVRAPDPAPPLFLVTEADHGPVTDGLIAIFSIWKDSDQKVELHIYEVPNFSMTVDLWGDRLIDWMVERGILNK